MFIVPDVLNLFRSVRAIFLERFFLTYHTDGAKETIVRFSINISSGRD